MCDNYCTYDVDHFIGFIEISRRGWTLFTYKCIVLDQELTEITQTLSSDDDERFTSTSITETVVTNDEFIEGNIKLYI